MNGIIYKLIEVFINSAVVLGFFFALIINRKKKSNTILTMLLIVLSVSIAHSSLIDFNVNNTFKIKEPFILLIGPLLFLYIRQLISPRKYLLTDIIHLLPFVVFTLLFLPLLILTNLKSLLQNNVIELVSIGLWAFTIFQYAYYWRKIIRLINTSTSHLQFELSNLEGKTLTWMKNFLHIFGVCLVFLTFTIPVILHTNNYQLVDRIICFSLACTIFVLVYEGLFQEEVFSNSRSIDPVEKDKNPSVEEVKTQQPSQERSELLQKLLTYMEEKKPYLAEGITISDLAGQLNINRNQLSALINNNTGENFYKFINRYRVEEVKRIFSDPARQNYTILAMAYEAGFPSKSSFNNIFKNFTGFTPTEYRNNLLNP